MAAADPRGRIAYDFCYFDWNEEPYLFCDLYVADADGAGAFLVAADGIRPVWSPDGSKIAFSGGGDGGPVSVLNISDGSITRLANGLGCWAMAWSPDGSRIALHGIPPGGAWGLYVTNVDGSGTERIADVSLPDGGPSWSPDGARIAFNCTLEAGNVDICTIAPDGTGLVRLTAGAQYDAGPAYSPDGSRIAFTTSLAGIAVMNADGSGVTLVGPGRWPDWSFDGSRFAYAVPFEGACDADRLCYDTVHVVNADGTAVRELGIGSNPSWRHSATPMGPLATFTSSCVLLHCDLDGSGSWDLDGTIISYEWDFGDGATGSGVTAAHTYAQVGPYVVTLTVTDDNGRVGTASRTVVSPPVPVPPVASFNASCLELACGLDGSASFDPDGEIVAYEWTFGDGGSGQGRTTSHTYAMPGTYVVTLTVTDDDGLVASQMRNVTALVTRAHVGDLDGRALQSGGKWTALVTITVHDYAHAPVANAVLTGSWSAGGTGTCATDGAGQCTVARSSIPNSVPVVNFTVGAVTHPQLTYHQAANHDPDGESNGTIISVRRR